MTLGLGFLAGAPDFVYFWCFKFNCKLSKICVLEAYCFIPCLLTPLLPVVVLVCFTYSQFMSHVISISENEMAIRISLCNVQHVMVYFQSGE